VTRVDAGTTEVEVIDLGDEAEPASITAGQNALWFTDEFLPGFAPIEPKERTVPTSFPIADPYTDVTLGDIVVGEGAVWVASVQQDGPVVSSFLLDGDPSAGTHGHISGGEGLVELASGGAGIWASWSGGVRPYSDDGPSRTRVAPVPGAGDIVYGAASVWTVVDGGAVVRLVPQFRTAAEDVGIEVARDVVDLEVAAKVPANAEPGAHIAFGEGSVWVVSGSNGDGELVQIDPAKDEVVGRFRLSGGPFAVAAGEGWLWVTDEGGDRIMRIDPQSPGGRPGTP
jgi:hypothetical protein